jgi:5-methylcytosine-specific restriction endonuclease McrA
MIMDQPNTWLGKAHPINDTAVARDYWCSDASIDELMAKYAPTAPKAHFYKIPGPAVLDLKCIDCGKLYLATSRQRAQSELTYRHGKHRCDACDSANRKRQFQESIRKSEEKLQRDEELRWMPYQDYLGTDEWSERRKIVIRRAEFKCQICAADGKLHVHHRTYARRGVERIADMIALCADCHELFHKNGRLAHGGRG